MNSPPDHTDTSGVSSSATSLRRVSRQERRRKERERKKWIQKCKPIIMLEVMDLYQGWLEMYGSSNVSVAIRGAETTICERKFP
jgi:hypothetical protein